MGAIQDHDYLKICAQLASCLSISLAAARRKVELISSREGIKDLQGRQKIAIRLLEDAQSASSKGKDSAGVHLDKLLEALAEEENFMIED